jgi:ABC-type sugar transport system ATPase subunit
VISARSLVAQSGAFRLAPINLEVKKGELLVLLGPSGAGKTVLLEALIGLRKLCSGRIFLEGEDVTARPPEARSVAYLPQDLALFPHLSVRANMEFGRRVRGELAGLEDDLARIADSLEIAHLLSRPSVGSLSGGEAQRVALARAFLQRPRALFLDESFSALDRPIRRRLLAEFRALQKKRNLAAIYVTHDLHEAVLLGDRIAVMMEGAIVQVSSAERLFFEPRDLRVARFLALENVHRVVFRTERRCRVGSIDLDIAAPLPACGPLWLAFSPSEILLVYDGESEITKGRNRFFGTIVALEKLENRVRAKIALGEKGDPEIVCELALRDRLRLEKRLEPGTEVCVHIPPEAIVVFPGAP